MNAQPERTLLCQSSSSPLPASAPPRSKSKSMPQTEEQHRRSAIKSLETRTSLHPTLPSSRSSPKISTKVQTQIPITQQQRSRSKQPYLSASQAHTVHTAMKPTSRSTTASAGIVECHFTTANANLPNSRRQPDRKPYKQSLLPAPLPG